MFKTLRLSCFMMKQWLDSRGNILLHIPDPCALLEGALESLQGEREVLIVTSNPNIP